MSHGVRHLEYTFLGQQRLHLFASNDVALLQRLYREILASVFVLTQNDLRKHKK